MKTNIRSWYGGAIGHTWREIKNKNNANMDRALKLTIYINDPFIIPYINVS